MPRAELLHKKGCMLHLSPSPLSGAVFTQLCFVKCVGEAFIIIFLVIYLPKIAQHLFCGELLSQSFTVALTDAKGGHGPYSVILKTVDFKHLDVLFG